MRPWRGGKAQSVGHISAAGGRRAAGFGIKPHASRAIATAATGFDTLGGNGSSGTGELGMTSIEPDVASSIKDKAQSYYQSKLTQQQAKSTAAANKTVTENKSKSPKAFASGKIKLRSAGHNLFRPPANKPTFQKTKQSQEFKSSSPAQKTAKNAATYRMKK